MSYNVFRADRCKNRKGGGICAWINNTFSVETVVSYSLNEDVEVLMLCISKKSVSCNVVLLILYFPHGSNLNYQARTSAHDYILSLVDRALENDPNQCVIICGDFNRVDHTVFEANLNLTNVVKSATRRDAMLDLILLSDSIVDCYQEVKHLPPLALSDHEVLLLKPRTDFVVSESTVKVYDFRDSCVYPAMIYLQSLTWENIFMDQSLDECVRDFYHHLKAALNLLPVNLIKRSTKDKPWMTATIKVLINKRYKAYRQKNWPLYYHFREKVKSAIMNSKASWGKYLIQKGKSPWDVYKCVLNKTVNRDWLPNCNPYKDIRSALEFLNESYTSVMVDGTFEIKNMPFIVPFQFHADEVYDELSQINPRAGTGSDDIPSIFWSKLAATLSQPLCHIFNACLKTANLPDKWKTADICPFPKSYPPTLSDTRPIAKLPIPERIFEKCLLKRIKFEFLNRYDTSQFGFRPTSSTTCALVKIQEFVLAQLDRSNVQACHICALDLTKGFDRLSHKILTDKMIKDNFPPFVINFIQNYLRNRSQRVKWNGTISSVRRFTSGVPQGSSLGPLVFAYFVSDFVLNNVNDCIVVKYADDVTLCGAVTNKSSNVPSAYSLFRTWSLCNEMTINESKSCQMFVTKRKGSCLDISNCKLDDIPVKNVMKLLGVVFDDKMKWNEHVNFITKKATSRMNVLRRLKPFVSGDFLMQIYYGCIRSILEYCAPLFLNLHEYQSSAIERVQRRCHRIICGSDCRRPCFIPLDYRRTVLAYRLFLSIVRNTSHPLYKCVPDIMPRSRKYQIPLCLTAARSKAFFIAMSKLANDGFSF